MGEQGDGKGDALEAQTTPRRRAMSWIFLDAVLTAAFMGLLKGSEGEPDTNQSVMADGRLL